jgi:DNA-binding winged helix-turn-helix (wHTH) protein/TolB-like protein
MLKENRDLYEFGDYRLDTTEHALTRLDGSRNGQLPEKAFQALCLLVENSGHLLTKSELIDHLWPDIFVEDNNLDKCIHAIRQVLGEKPNEHKYIQTVRKHGYRFVAEVRRSPNAPNGNNGSGDGSISAALPALTQTSATPTGRTEDALPTPTGESAVRNTAPRYLATALLVAVVIAGLYFVPKWYAVPDRPTALAVLPLKPIDTTNRNVFHEGGITDSLILRLSAVKGLTVRPLSAIRKYSDIGQDPIAAGREQIVDYVLATNYQIAGDRIQVTGQLYDVATGQVTETLKIEKDVDDSFAMQDAVAREISDILVGLFDLASGAPTSKRGTNNEIAYRSYLNGSNLMARTSLPIAQESVEYLEEAVRLDPQFARAYAGLARSRVELSNLVDDPAQDCDKARTAVEHALALDPNLAEAYQASGLRKLRCAWDFAGAEPDLRRALELDPNSDSAHSAYASYLNSVGRADEAVTQIRQAITLNPNSVTHHIQHGIILYTSRRYDDSIAELRHAGEIGQLGMAYGWLWTAYIAKGDDAQAFEVFLRSESEKQLKPDPAKIEQLKSIFRTSGWRGIREMQLAAEKASPIYTKGRFYRLSRLSTQVGNVDDAFAYLNKALERRDAQVLLLECEPTFDSLRSDPRYYELLRRIGFPNDG